jgi:membrane protease YdiL (CAAX protease family)
MTSRRALRFGPVRVSIVAALVAYLAVRGFWLGVENVRAIAESPFFEGFWKLLVWVGPCLIAAMALARASLHEAWRDLGLGGPAARGFVFGLIATIPMALAALLNRPHLPNFDALVGTVLFGPFAEEVLFRGFLFTALWKHARWPWPAALAVSSVAFGFAHQYGPGAVTLTLGGAALAWIYYKWGSLWPAIGLHAWMNFWWDISRGVDYRGRFVVDAAGITQIVSMLLAVAVTLWLRPKVRSSQFEVRS